MSRPWIHIVRKIMGEEKAVRNLWLGTLFHSRFLHRHTLLVWVMTFLLASSGHLLNRSYLSQFMLTKNPDPKKTLAATYLSKPSTYLQVYWVTSAIIQVGRARCDLNLRFLKSTVHLKLQRALVQGHWWVISEFLLTMKTVKRNVLGSLGDSHVCVCFQMDLCAVTVRKS